MKRVRCLAELELDAVKQATERGHRVDAERKMTIWSIIHRR